VGQFLALVTDEIDFLKRANVGGGGWPPVGTLPQRTKRWLSSDYFFVVVVNILYILMFASLIASFGFFLYSIIANTN
jgi:hypothetical protein